EYALGILRVREIIQHDALTRVPAAPAWVRGVINLRGSVVPVVDLAVRFGMGESAVTRWTCLVIVEVALRGEQVVVGLMADAVSQVMELRPDDIEPPPSFGTGACGQHLLGMARTEGKFALILDIDGVLASLDAAEAIAAAPGEETAAEGEDGPSAPHAAAAQA
ncbi:MAG TPA: chemotaxis protein CheW, partial [Longimicrobiaceae bacterium]|nr:chemotaxis protein CheW [Longimicrobiaceae bacterium]